MAEAEVQTSHNNRHHPAMAVQSTHLDIAYLVLITLLAEIYSPCDPPSN